VGARACVLTGIGTVRATIRAHGAGGNVAPAAQGAVDSRRALSCAAVRGGRTLVAAAVDDREKAARLRDRGAEVVLLPNSTGKVELTDLMRELARRELNEIHVEAGFKLNGSLVAAGVVDELLVYLAPSLIGESGSGMFNLPALDDLAQRRRLVWRDVQRIGPDLRVVAGLA
jgi:diaminohydroxyphosphoribosylaminopyrimidine deaminase/5-amino-6-(5-phosphoribosylamino)uracil reductase